MPLSTGPSPPSSPPRRRDRTGARGADLVVIGSRPHVGLVFNTVNRMANAFDWTWNSDQHVRVAAAALHRLRYELPGFVLR